MIRRVTDHSRELVPSRETSTTASGDFFQISTFNRSE